MKILARCSTSLPAKSAEWMFCLSNVRQRCPQTYRKKVFVLTCARVYMTLDPLPHLVPVETVSLKYI